MRLRALVPALALMALPAAAQDAHFGLQLGLSLPQGDTSTAVDSHTGFTLGFQVPVDLKNGHMIRPRLDWTQHSGSLYGIDIKVTTTALGLDYNYYFSQNTTRGVYLLAGLDYANTKFEASYGGASGSDTEGALGIAFGAGFQFNPTVGAELRYTTTHPDFGGDSFDNDAINLSVAFRF